MPQVQEPKLKIGTVIKVGPDDLTVTGFVKRGDRWFVKLNNGEVLHTKLVEKYV